MGLITTWGSNNRVITNDKTVTYSRRRITGSWTTQPTPGQLVTYNWCWEYHRYCNKTYQYVGMDLTTANACAAAMIQIYTRNTKVSEWRPDEDAFVPIDGGYICMADVTVQQRAGHMYDVVINVREDDMRLSRQIINPETLFAFENARSYDT